MTAGPRSGAAAPPLLPHVCQVWWSGPADVRAEHDALLGPADLERRSRLSQVPDRQRLTATWAVARVVLAAATGVPPAGLEFDRTCPGCGAQHGKPWLPAAPDVHFSVTHSGGCIAVAVLRDRPVGVDVEEVRRFDPAELEQLAAAVLAAEERAELARQPAGGRALAFSTYWARKEAALKATGEGLAAPLDRLVVSPPASPPRVLRRDDAPGFDRLSMYPLHPPPGHVAALAVAGEGPVVVEEHDAGPLLGSRQSSRRLPSATTRSQR